MYEQEAQENIPFNMSKLLLMGVISLVLCMSFVMSIFAPFPLAFASVIYGRRPGYSMAAGAWVLSLFLSSFLFGDQTIFMAYTLSVIVAMGISEIVLLGLSPVRAMVKFGSAILILLSFILLLVVKIGGVNLKENLVQQINENKEVFELQKEKLEKSQGSQDAFETIALLEQPEALAEEVLKQAPGYFFMGTFLIIWANLFLLLRSYRMINKGKELQYTEKDLLQLKVPDHFIWLVIVGALMFLWGDSLGKIYPIIGLNMIKFLGIFYFFQGFGIYLDFLDYVKLKGFLRTVLVMLTILTAAQFLALFGLFDMFVNFRRFFKKNSNEGE